MAKLTEIGSLEKAFEGCRGVFHTTAFTDPAGLSGYTVSLSLSLSSFVPKYVSPNYGESSQDIVLRKIF